MVTLRADENRYLIDAGPADQALLRRLPGGRWNSVARRWQFRRERGLILALDLVFGPANWSPGDDAVGIDTEAARAPLAHPEGPVSVTREGSQLRVTCGFADRELVKSVPGYRWSAPDRCWFLPAMPVALHLLQSAFGPGLDVTQDIRDYMDLRERDELEAVDRARALLESPAAAPAVPPTAAVTPVLSPPSLPDGVHGLRAEIVREVTLPAAAGQPLPVDVIDRLATAVERLVGVIDRLDARLAAAPAIPEFSTPAPAPEPAEEPGAGAGPGPDWAELLRQSENPDEAAQAASTASRMLQIAGEGASRELRAVAAICQARAGNRERAFGQLSAALGPAAELANKDLEPIARQTLLEVTLGFLNANCGPRTPITGPESLRSCILDELLTGAGFDSSAIGSSAAQGVLEQLMVDQPLRTLDPLLSDLCRVLHLLSLARGRVPLLANRVAALLEDSTLRADAVGLAIIIRTNIALGAESVDDWEHRWPSEEQFAPDENAAAAARRALPFMDPHVAPRAALAALASIANLPPDDRISLRDRRELVNWIPRNEPIRRYAEFLAVFRIAAAGDRAPWDEFPGYIEIVSRKELATTADHIVEAYLAGAGAGSAARLLADRAVLPGLKHDWGITDPEKHVLDLLPVLAEGSRPDNLLNELGQLLEDDAFVGASMFSHEQRLKVYRAAFDASLRQGHDKDAREAFHRLVRELQDEPGAAGLRQLCAEALERFRPLRVPALALQAELLLEEGADADDVATALSAAMNGREDDAEEARTQLLGLQYISPEFNERMRALLSETPEGPKLEAPPSFPGKRVVIFGGRQYLRKYGDAVLQGWGMDTEWLDAAAAKQGDRARDLAAGKADLLVINTACIGHAASGRIADAARAAGREPFMQNSNGVGSMLIGIKTAMEAIAAAPAEDPGRRAKRERRKRLVP